MEALTGRELAIDPTKIHHRWQKDLEPALEIRSGDTVDFDLLVAGDPNIQEGMTASDAVFDFETIYNLSGPVFVVDAQPGDTLQIEILEAHPREWGWVAILPELGLVPEDFPNAVLKTIDIRNGKVRAALPGRPHSRRPLPWNDGEPPRRARRRAALSPHRGEATWTTVISPRDRCSTCRCGARERCSHAATRTQRRVTARSASPRSSAR